MKKILLAILLLSVSVSACGGGKRHIAVVADSVLYELLMDVHSTEQTALCGRPSCAGIVSAPTVAGWTEAKSRAFNKSLLPAVEGGRQFNRVLAEWKPGQPVPTAVSDLTQSVGAAVGAVAADFPDSPEKTKLLTTLAKAQEAVIRVMAAVMGRGL